MATSITVINENTQAGLSRNDINNNFDSLLDNKIETDVISTDSTFTGASDSKIASQLATKLYVDSGGNQNASETQKGIVEEATDSEVTAGTATGSTGAKLFITPAKLATRISAFTTPVVRTYLTAASPATWTKPAGLKYVVIEIQGAGGGGQSGSNSHVEGSQGGTSSFGSHCSATGGKGTVYEQGDGSNGDINISGETCPYVIEEGGENNGYGGLGGSSVFGRSYTPDSTTSVGRKGGYGAGGSGGSEGSTGGAAYRPGHGGCAGGYSKKLIPAASLGSTETVTIGAGGAGGVGAGPDGGDGGDGIVIVTEYYI